ncbi:hypothetical protein J2Y51_002589 [Bosea sp. BE109]|jgi:hypothetical protein|nr:hypothetical protein [Bosea sp. BE109]
MLSAARCLHECAWAGGRARASKARPKGLKGPMAPQPLEATKVFKAMRPFAQVIEKAR